MICTWFSEDDRIWVAWRGWRMDIWGEGKSEEEAIKSLNVAPFAANDEAYAQRNRGREC